jgi:hypothetical protein
LIAAHSRRPQKNARCSWPGRERRRFPRFGCFQRYRAAVFTGDAIGKSEAQADASKFAFADERFEQSHANLLGDARAAIHNLELNPIHRVDQRNPHLWWSAAFSCRLAAVEQQVIKGALQLLAVNPPLQRRQGIADDRYVVRVGVRFTMAIALSTTRESDS